jgi:hypothetical protein
MSDIGCADEDIYVDDDYLNKPAFFGEDGTFSKDMLLQFISSIDSDPSGRMRLYWDNLQNTALTQQFYAKYLSLFSQSNIVNKLQLTDQLAGNNNTFNVEFVMVPFGFQKDSTIVVSDKEIKAYYNSHKKFYKQPASRDIEYVEFEIKPSAEDVELANNAIVKVYDEFKNTNDVKNFLSRNSDRKFDETWYKEGDLNTVSRKVNDFVFNSNQKVSEVIDDNESLFVVRVLGTKKEDGVVKKQVAIFEKAPYASEKTKSAAYAKANAFAAEATGSYENFTKAVQEQGLYARPVSKMLEGTDRLGSIERTKEITRWAFDAKKAGKASNIITVDNKYFFVAALTGIHEDEYAPVSDVAESIRQRIYSEKVQAKTLAEVTAKIEGKSTIEAAAEVFSAPIDNSEALSFAATTVDPAIIGAASVAPEGSVYGPVAGSLGVYVLNVSNKQVGTFYTEEDAKNLAKQKAQFLAQLVIPVMSQENEVVDNRARFY